MRFSMYLVQRSVDMAVHLKTPQDSVSLENDITEDLKDSYPGEPDPELPMLPEDGHNSWLCLRGRRPTPRSIQG